MKTKSILIALLVIVISASCSPATTKVISTETTIPPTIKPSDTPNPTATPTVLPTSTPTATPVPAFPGSYLTSISTEDLKNGGAKDLSLAGDWLLSFPAVTTVANYEVLLNGTRSWGGTIVADGDKIKITTANVGADCQREGIYTWTFDGTYLILTAESDSCTNRIIIFSQHPLVRQP